jgi:RHS repeat-associated protein
VTALASSAGALQASYRYDPYGRYLAGGGPLVSANVLRFSSKPWVGFAGSATSGLYYYGYRFYDPYLQRWMNRDLLGEEAGLNIYQFVHNVPISLVDAYGLETLEDCLKHARLVHKNCKQSCTTGTVIMFVLSAGLGAITINPWLSFGAGSFSLIASETCNNNCDNALYDALDRCRHKFEHECP